jgi:hypothetical protein
MAEVLWVVDSPWLPGRCGSTLQGQVNRRRDGVLAGKSLLPYLLGFNHRKNYLMVGRALVNEKYKRVGRLVKQMS